MPLRALLVLILRVVSLTVTRKKSSPHSLQVKGSPHECLIPGIRSGTKATGNLQRTCSASSIYHDEGCTPAQFDEFPFDMLVQRFALVLTLLFVGYEASQ